MKNKRIFLLVLTMTVIAISVSGMAISTLYHTAIEQQTMRLAETVKGQARMLEAVARFNDQFHNENGHNHGGALSATLRQARDAQETFKGFGETGEFCLAKREGNQIVFLLRQRPVDIETLPLFMNKHFRKAKSKVSRREPPAVPLTGTRARPMQLALEGKSGTIIARDYSGVMVLAAFEPVAGLDLGIVAKIDLAEIRKDFLNAGILVAIATLLLVLLGTFLVRRIGNPLVRQLEENEHRLRVILDTAADGIITTNEQGLINSFNQAAEHIFGYRSEEAIGNNIATLIAEPYPDPQPNDDIHSKKRFINSKNEVTGFHKDGSSIPLEITASEILENKARLRTCIVRDISERKQSLMDLHQREEELRLIFENAPVGIYICNLDGFILRANYAACTLLGYTELELLAKRGMDIIHADNLPEVQALCDQLLTGELDSVSLEVNLVEKRGINIPCTFRRSLIFAKNGSPQLWVAHIEDRSEQIKTEQTIREHSERLAHVTRLSTMGEMAASLAHEINQPLSAISTYASACQRLIAQDQPLPDEVQPTLNKINAQALRAGDIVRRLREFTRNRKTDSQQLECLELITEVIAFAEVDANYHHVTIHKELEPDLPSIYVDSVQIQQVILNLLRNAFDSMEQETTLSNKEVRLRVKRQGDKAIEISVTDRGTGISPQSATQIFSPFFTTKPLGIGIGLSISRSIINAHGGGQLQYAANPEGGSIFLFTLPIYPRT